MKKSILFVLPSLLLAACAGGQKDGEAPKALVKISNPIALDRTDELVQVNLAEALQKVGLSSIDSLVVIGPDGQQVPYQTGFNDRDLVFPVTVAGNSTVNYLLSQGVPQTFTPVVAGRQYPERVDDFAWENEFSAYRCYGPALQASGERAYGFDVWTKNTADLVVEDRYMSEHQAKPEIERLRKEGKKTEAEALNFETSYHFEHGKGLDCYKVGATLGGGTPALYKNGQIIYPYCYTDYEILEEGPIRMTVKFDYEQKSLDGKPYTEHRIISFEKGSRLNTCIVFYEGLDQNTDAQVAAGIVVHSENKEVVINKEKGYIAYADPTDPSQGGVSANGSIFIGIFTPMLSDAKFQPWGKQEVPADMKARGGAEGHLLALMPFAHPQIYFFGSSWSKYDMPDMAAWEKYLTEFGEKYQNPLSAELQ